MLKTFILPNRISNQVWFALTTATVAVSTVTLATPETAHAFSFSVDPADTFSKSKWNGLDTTQIDFSNVPVGPNGQLQNNNGEVPQNQARTIATSSNTVNGNATIRLTNNKAVFTTVSPPAGVSGRYLAVGSEFTNTSNPNTSTVNTAPGGEVIFNFTAPRGLGYFGFYWATPSNSDRLIFTFRNAQGIVQPNFTLDASTIFSGIYNSGLLNGQNNAGRFVNFFSTNSGPRAGFVIQSVRFVDRDNSDNRSFEIDNIAYQQIPTPALLPGLVAMGIGVLRKRKATVEAEA